MLAALALALIVSHAFAGELCKRGRTWYDAGTGKCRPCDACGADSLKIAPCSEYGNTVCISLSSLSLKAAWEKKANAKWHEADLEHMVVVEPLEHATEERTIVKTIHYGYGRAWGVAVLVMLSAALITAIAALAVALLRRSGKFVKRTENRNAIGRTRLFSRDRLSTTDYMNSLAAMDRRLAMDEILEKRKKALFEPRLLNENFYADESVVPISGFPKNFRDEHDFEHGLDNEKRLLSAQDK